MADYRKQKRASRLSVGISFLLHAAIILALVFFAAREGLLGTQLKKITVTMVPKEKPPEPPKEKPPEPKPQVEPPKPETPKTAPVPQPQGPPAVAKTVTAPPSSAPPVAPSVAPPPAEVPSFDFAGGKPVETTSDPGQLYKGYVEYSLRSRWNRPREFADEANVAEVELAIGPDGRLLGVDWKKTSGDAAWDDSVRQVLAQTTSFGRPPPKGFPQKVRVRFDVQGSSQMTIQ